LNKINGFIVEPRQPSQIADKLNLLIENVDLRNKMASESKRLYYENFTEKKWLKG
jgi:glycosyltransferase involved in cell wall biosynthesis